MIVIEKHIVPEGEYHIRIQEYAGNVFKLLQSRSATKKCIAKNLLLINGKIAQTSDWIKAGNVIELLQKQTNPKKIFPLKLDVIFEDDFLAAVNKPSGFPTNGNYFKTIENALPYNLKKSTQKDALTSPKPVHRLDNATSGILLIAKTKKVQIDLHKQFEDKTINKTYHAVIAGKPKEKGSINLPIENQEAITHFETVRTEPSIQNEHLTLIKLHPKTGRTHQLRIHLSQTSHPIIGDKLYASGNIMMHKGLFLCASKIIFKHPTTLQEKEVSIPLPKKFNSYLDREKRRFEKYHSLK